MAAVADFTVDLLQVATPSAPQSQEPLTASRIPSRTTRPEPSAGERPPLALAGRASALADRQLDTGASRCEECGTGSTRHTRRAHPRRPCALQAVAGLGPRRPRRACRLLCALQAVAGLGPRRPRRAYRL